MITDVSVGNFNADGKDDLFCRFSGGKTNVAISTIKGKKSEEGGYSGLFTNLESIEFVKFYIPSTKD